MAFEITINEKNKYRKDRSKPIATGSSGGTETNSYVNEIAFEGRELKLSQVNHEELTASFSLIEDDIPILSIAKIEDLQDQLDSKLEVEGSLTENHIPIVVSGSPVWSLLSIFLLSDFLEESFESHAGKIVAVDPSENGLIFIDAPSGGGVSGIVDLGDLSGAFSIDLSTGRRFKFRLTANSTFSFSNAELGADYTFEVTREANYTLSWASGKYRFPLGYAPVLTNTTTNGTSPQKAIDIITAVCLVSGRLDVVVTPDLRLN